MGLSNFPSPAEGVLPILVMNTVLSVAILKNLLKSFLEIIGATAVTASSGGSSWISSSMEEDSPETDRKRRVSITQFKSLCENQEFKVAGGSSSGDASSGGGCSCQAVECCVCLNRFEEEEEVSELSCKHFFHRSCLDKWFQNQHSTCPLCRSID